ncbi:MAG: class I SAM-dependent methyltransferase [Candidatus Paceibacterota bacterium]
MFEAYSEKYYEVADKHDNWDGPTQVKILEFIKNHYQAGQLVVELGCGSANITEFLPNDLRYLGLDSSPAALVKAKARSVKLLSAEFQQSGDEKINLLSGTANFMLCFYVLEHLHRPKEMLAEMARILAPGGFLILLAPNVEFPFSRLNALRHKNLFFKIWWFGLRLIDYLSRIFGHFRFRTIAENFSEAVGHYEKLDDDLTYAVSSYEVISFLQSLGLKLEFVGQPQFSANFLGRMKKLVNLLPAMKYYGDILFVIMKKPISQ